MGAHAAGGSVGQANDEARAGNGVGYRAGAVFRVQTAAVRFDDAPGDVEAEAGMQAERLTGRAFAVEAVEDRRATRGGRG